jgi:hypothetical protein
MTTALHRLQVSLPKSQVDFLADRARREGVSIAELIRRLVERAAAARAPDNGRSLWSIAGIAEERLPLIGGRAVSEHVALYIAESAAPHRSRRPASRATRKKARARKR